jgi:hypothetical protein
MFIDIRLFYQREGKHQVYRHKEEESPSIHLVTLPLIA